MPNSFRDVIDLWGADNLAKAIRVGKFAVRNWRQRENIPGGYWLDIERLAKRERKPVSLERLAKIAKRYVTNGGPR